MTRILTLSFDDGFEKSSLRTAEIFEKFGYLRIPQYSCIGPFFIGKTIFMPGLNYSTRLLFFLQNNKIFTFLCQIKSCSQSGKSGANNSYFNSFFHEN